MQWVRQGTVSTLNAEEMTVRVVFEDLDISVSRELAILVPPMNGQSYGMPQVGDIVVCILTETQGFVVGMVQQATPVMAVNDWGIWFDKDHQIIYSGGTVHIKSQQITLEGAVTVKSPTLRLEGDLQVSGNINGFTPGGGQL